MYSLVYKLFICNDCADKSVTDKKWKLIETSNYIEGRSSHGMIYHKNTIYIFCGSNADTTFNDVYCLPLDTNKWIKMEIDDVPYISGFTCHLYRNKIIIFGGFDDEFEFTRDLYSLDFKNNKIEYLSYNKNYINFEPTSDHASIMLNDKLYIYGGTSAGPLFGQTIYYIDFSSNILSLHSIKTDLPKMYGHTMLSYSNKSKMITCIQGFIRKSLINDTIPYDIIDTIHMFCPPMSPTVFIIGGLDTRFQSRSQVISIKNIENPDKLATQRNNSLPFGLGHFDGTILHDNIVLFGGVVCIGHSAKIKNDILLLDLNA